MRASTVRRTLIRSTPELWAEISDVSSLGRHLGEFGDIRITRLDEEAAVAWESDTATGEVTLEASGLGTRVTLTAVPIASPVAPPAPAPPAPPAPAIQAAPPPAAPASPPPAAAVPSAPPPPAPDGHPGRFGRRSHD